MIGSKLAEVQVNYPPGATDAPFLTNHDQIRLATQLGGDAGKLRNAPAGPRNSPAARSCTTARRLAFSNSSSDNDDRLKRTPMPCRTPRPAAG